MAKEITVPTPTILTAKSFDGKHTLHFNEKSHRYKLDGEACVGTTTFCKAGYPTSMGLVSWMKGQSIQYIWNSLMEQSPIKMWWNYKSTEYPKGIAEDERIQLFKEAKLADQKTSQEAADCGTILHEYCYLTELGKELEAQNLYNQIQDLPVKDKILNGIEKFKAWKKENKDEIVASESLIASPTHIFCGKFDRLVRRNGVLVLSDFKTSGGIYLDHFIQLGAYSIATKEWLGLEVKGLEVLRFGKEDGEFETLLIDKPEEIKMFEEQAIRCRQTYEFKKLENDPRWEWKKK